MKRIFQSKSLPYYSTPIIVLIFLAAWQLYVTVTETSQLILPGPITVIEAFLHDLTQEYVWSEHIWTTFYEVMVSLAFASVLGIGLGFFIGKFAIFEKITRPFIIGTQVVPKVALIPLFLLWFGLGSTPTIVIATLLAFFPLLINTALGVRSIPQSLHDLMTSLRASGGQRFRKLELRHTVPYILAGFEIAVVQAVIGAIVGEFLSGQKGLGAYAVVLQAELKVPRLFGAILIMAIFGLLLYSIVTWLRRTLVTWHQSS